MRCLRQTLSGIKMTEGNGFNMSLVFTVADGYLSAGSHTVIKIPKNLS